MSLACLRAVDPAEANPFRALVVEDFNRIAVKDGDEGPGKSAKAGPAKMEEADKRMVR
jgi:hypothetical protein